MITYFQTIVLAIVQGVTELFPISSLGHSILIANLLGWHDVLKQETSEAAGLLTLLVVMHVATAIALLIFYRDEWVRIIKGFFRSLKTRKLVGDSDAKLAWLLAIGTVPAALVALVFEHALRSRFAEVFPAIIFLGINGIILIKGDKVVKAAQKVRPRDRSKAETHVDELSVAKTGRVVSDSLSLGRALLIGMAQVAALFPGISRSGVTMIAGLRSGLSHQDAARFSFLLATPIILGAGLYKLPDVIGSDGDGIRGQAIVGGIVAGITAYLTVRYLDKYFQSKSLRPFGIYCICAAVFMLLLGIWRGSFG